MKLIKISDNRIFDMDTVTDYCLRESTKINELYATQTNLGGLLFVGEEADNLWGYLEENANNQTFNSQIRGKS